MLDIRPAFDHPAVDRAFAAFPDEARACLLALRSLIFETAATTPGVGRLQEALKWGQPAYLTPETKSGSTLRLGLPKSGGVAIFAHCQTTIVSDFRALMPEGFRYEGNRALCLDPDAALPEDALRLFIVAALTYHLR